MTNLYVIKKDGKYLTKYDKSILRNPNIWENDICSALIYDNEEYVLKSAKVFEGVAVQVEVREVESITISSNGTITEPGLSDLDNEGC